MIIVGELINASRHSIARAIKEKDAHKIQKISKDQKDNGADFLDLNAGIFVQKEAEYLKWLVTTVQEAVDAPCCIDSPSPSAIENALRVHRGAAMINSISFEKERYEGLISLISGVDCKIVALCISNSGMPETADDRVAIADKLINGLVKHNMQLDNIYVDPLIQPIAINDRNGIEFLKAIEMIVKKFPGVHTICGLSNISYGLPKRPLLNQVFMAMAIEKGLDAAIVNPLDKRTMAVILAAEVLVGKDDYCGRYLESYKESKFDF